MDILTHAIVGSAVGYSFGSPIACAVVACVPDIVLGIKRKHEPTRLYKLFHSVFPALILWSIGFEAEAISWGSHILLDIPTHGEVWSPNLLYPFYRRGFSCFEEWEFFNKSWLKGLAFSIGVVICLML